MKHIQPPEVFASTPLGFTQVVTSPPGELVFVSGQVAFDESLKVVGGPEPAGQAVKALENLGHSLEAAGATPADVAFLRIYVAGYEPSHAGAIGRAVSAFFGETPPPAQTLLGVQALATPELRIELEALAVLPG